MQLDDIQKSYDQLSPDELREKLQEIQKGRLQTYVATERKAKKSAVSKKQNALSILKKAGLTNVQIKQLLAEQLKNLSGEG